MNAAYVCGIAAAAISALPAPAQAAPVELEVGDTRTLSAGGAIRQVVVDVADVVATNLPGPRQLEVRGVKPGDATVTLVSDGGRASYSVRVVEAGAADAAALRQRLAEQPGLEGVRVDRRDGRTVLSGTVTDSASHERATTLAGALMGKDVTDLIQVTGSQMVAVDVRFVAVSDTTLKSLGFNFSKLSGGFQSAIVGPGNLSGYGSNTNGLRVNSTAPIQGAFNLFLNGRSDGILGVISALSEAGLSQVLAQPTLLARSGEQADFIAGGEVPIPVPQAGNSGGVITIEYRAYGVRLSVEPYVLSNRRIALKLAPEVSELDRANGVTVLGTSVPGFRRRSANTTVELGDGESFVIAGLTYSTSAITDGKVPLLGDIPILGSLFRRNERSQEKLELIIVATPRLVSPLSPADAARITAAPLPPPSLGDSILNPGATEKRATSFGLSR